MWLCVCACAQAAQAAAQEADIRKRAAEQLVNALQLAVGDIRRKGKVGSMLSLYPGELHGHMSSGPALTCGLGWLLWTP